MLTQLSFGRVVEGFESGDPAVTSTGDGSIQGTFQGEVAPQGTHQFLITTIRAGDGDSNTPASVSGTNAVNNMTLEGFFNGLSLIGTEGSGVLIPFTVLAGDTNLTLQYDFLTNEDVSSTHHNDFAFDAIFNSSNAVVSSSTFAQVNTANAQTLFGGGSPFIFHTGFQTLALNISSLAPGNYTLGIGVEDMTTSDGNSGVLLDNVQIVPEPSSIAFCIAGATLLLALRRVKRSV